jgi:hypothetical protein
LQDCRIIPVKRADDLMSSVKAGSKNNIRYEVVGRRETERNGMELSMDMLMKVKGKRY